MREGIVIQEIRQNLSRMWTGWTPSKGLQESAAKERRKWAIKMSLKKLRNANIVGFTRIKERESMGVFNKFDKENVEKAEEYLDKLEGAIELEEEGGYI